MKSLDWTGKLLQRLYAWVNSITYATIMKFIKHLVTVLIVLLCVCGAYYCLNSSVNAPNLTPRESALLNYLLCLFSVLATWLASHYYTIYSVQTSTAEKIDTIAQQSAEKIMNQSAQLWEVERFLKTSVEVAENENDAPTANNILSNRILGSAQMIRLLRSSNSTFTSDWTGVASAGVRTTLESQVKQQQELLKIYDEVESAEPEADDEPTDQRQDQQTREPSRRLQEVTRALPAAALPTAQPPNARAVTTTQFPQPSTNDLARGGAVLRVLRPVDNVTGHLRFVPRFETPPNVTLTLVSVPQGVQAAELAAHAGAATRSGCPIHITRHAGGTVVIGSYEIHYEARPAQPQTPQPPPA